MRLMRFGESEVKALVLVAGSKQPLHPADLTHAINLRPESISRLITALANKGLLERDGKEIASARTPLAEAFKKLYFAHRASPFSLLLADRRVDLLYRIENVERSSEVLEKETGIPIKTIYRYLKDFLHLGVVKRTKKGKIYLFSFNYVLWPELKNFVVNLLEYEVLRLVPREGLLIKSYGDNALFKSLRQQDATPTSFSAYREHGILLGLRDNYYTLPKRRLSIMEIFLHSLDSAENVSQRTYCILFYLKNRVELQGVQHPMMKDIIAVLRGERVKGYPALEEINEQAELYGIEQNIDSQRGRRDPEKPGKASGAATRGSDHRRCSHA
jgi:predicted transcriptional regulator